LQPSAPTKSWIKAPPHLRPQQPSASSMHVSSADAQSVYVAPGGVYVGGGPVYVIPAPNNGPAPYVAPTYGYEYGPPAVVAPAPAVVAPTTVYGPNGGYYAPPAIVAPASRASHDGLWAKRRLLRRAAFGLCGGNYRRGRAWPYPIPATVVVPLATVTAPAIELSKRETCRDRPGGAALA
jgi:hypothetical protein